MALVPLHNESASLANLARTVLSGVTRSQLTTPVQTETLVLLLNRLIDLLEPRQAGELAQVADKSVRQLVASVETAIRNRDEDEWQARGGDKAPVHKGWT